MRILERIEAADAHPPHPPAFSSSSAPGRDETESAGAGLASQCWEERYAATVRLGRLGRDPVDVVALLGRLRDDCATVRAAAANALAELHQLSVRGGPMLRITVQGLLVLLEDDEVSVRLTARRSLVACIIIAVRLLSLHSAFCFVLTCSLLQQRGQNTG